MSAGIQNESEDAIIDRRLADVTGEAWSTGNRIFVLENGDEIFAAMLSAIEKAEKDIRLLTYVYWEGEIAWEFARAIAAKARSGVSCRVLLDAHGGFRISHSLLLELEEAGVIVAKYNPFSFRDPLRYQHRTHRKILLCDGDVGFIGGVGIADEWRGDARNPNERHDFHFQVEGPSVNALANAFQENWQSEWTEYLRNGERPAKMPGHRGDHELYQIPEEHSGFESDIRVLPLLSSPFAKRSEANQAYVAMLRSARERVRIVSAYLIPDREMISLFRETTSRGVEVDIVLPGRHRDSWLAQSRSRSMWDDMLEAGVRLHLYQPTMCHAKFTIIDNDLVTIGSINFDLLSFRLNEEANLIVRSADFAELMIQKFNQDKEKSLPVDLQQFRKRSHWKRFKEKLARKFPLPYWGRDCNY